MNKPAPESGVSERYEALAAEFLARPEVTRAGAGSGAKALKVRGRIFATLSPSADFIVKLPEQRVETYVASGDGIRCHGAGGRVTKEWMSVRPDTDVPWSRLAEEAMEFVRGR